MNLGNLTKRSYNWLLVLLVITCMAGAAVVSLDNLGQIDVPQVAETENGSGNG